MIPRGHPAPARTAGTGSEGKVTSTWIHARQPLCDGTVEAWLLDQLSLTTMPIDLCLARYEEIARLFRRIRTAHAASLSVAEICETCTPSAIGEWRWFEVNGVFQIWRMGRAAFVLEFRSGEDGEMRWRAGHDFGTPASCSAWLPKRKGQDPGSCGRESAVLAPVCLTHAGKGFTENLAKQGLKLSPPGASDEANQDDEQ